MEDTGVRITQRAPQSCQRCSSKKMRCSKTVPCQACVNQGLSLECRRENVIVTKQIRSTNTQHSKRRRVDDQGFTGNPPPARAHPKNVQSIRRPSLPPMGSPSNSSPDHETTAAMLMNLSRHLPERELTVDDLFRVGNEHQDTEHQSQDQHHWPVPALTDFGTPPITAQSEASPFDNTLSSLEALVWGRQRDGGAPPATASVVAAHGTPDEEPEDQLLSHQQAIEIFKYHWRWLTWTHNIIHWQGFRDECQTYWAEGLVKEKAWLALYYGVLCVGLHHMTAQQRLDIGFAHDSNVAEQLYKKCVDSLQKADYAAVHSVTSVQAICLLVLCAHDFSGSNLLAVLLSSAIRIAQSLNIHRLGPDPTTPLPYPTALEREIHKSVWMFLCTQDWLMIPFSNAHSISPSYCTTPVPLNCNVVSGVGEKTTPFISLPMEEQTLMSYQLIMHRVANVLRNFFDSTSCIPSDDDQDASMRRLYDQVLKTDSEMEAIVATLPQYIRPNCQDVSGSLPCYVPRQRYHLAISIAHKTLIIHRRFFLTSLTNRWYNYTKTTCVNCACTILTQFRLGSDERTSRNLWSVLPHVVSASMILLFEMMFSNTPGEGAEQKRQLVTECLTLLKKSDKTSSLMIRGINLIELLLEHSAPAQGHGQAAAQGITISTPNSGVGNATGQLSIKAIATLLAKEKTTMPAGANPPPSDLLLADLDLGDPDTWMQYLDLSFTT